MASTIVVSYSELDTYRQCPLKHAIAYKERWTKPPTVGGALDKGTLWHKVLEAHYTTIKAYQAKDGSFTVGRDYLGREVAQTVFPLLFDLDTGAYLSETAELIHWMYQGYLDTYGLDHGWKILAVEHNAQIPLLDVDPATGVAKRTRFRIKAKIDLVVKDLATGQLWVVDHKSGKDLPNQRALELDDQFGLYTLLLHRQNKPVFGQVYNASRTQRNKTGVQTLDSRNSRTRLYRTDIELLAIERDALKVCRAAYGPGTNKQDPYSSPNTDTCKWKCDFADAHLMARKSPDEPVALRQYLGDFGFAQNFERH